MLLQLMWRTARRDEMYLVEVKTAVGSTRHLQVATMNWIEGTTKKRDAARMMFCGGAGRPGRGQCGSPEGAGLLWLFSDEPAGKYSADTGSLRGSFSSALAMARTNSRTPSPVAAEMEWNSSFRWAQKSRSASRRARPVVASSLVATMIIGFSASDSLNAASSPLITLKE